MKRLFYFIVMSVFLSGCTSETALKKEEARDYLKEGTDFLSKGNPYQAIKVFKEAATQNPADSRLHFVLAQTYMYIADYNNAMDHFKATIQLEPDNGEAYLLLGGCYDLLGKKDEAIENVKKSIAMFYHKRDEKNFKRSLAIFKNLTAADNHYRLGHM